MKIICRTTGETAKSYAEYLTTMHWKQIKEKAFQRAKGKCKACKKQISNSFVGHHDSTGAYRRVGRERIGHWFWPDDVIAVCKHCHDVKYRGLLHLGIKVPDWAKR